VLIYQRNHPIGEHNNASPGSTSYVEELTCLGCLFWKRLLTLWPSVHGAEVDHMLLDNTTSIVVRLECCCLAVLVQPVVDHNKECRH